MIRSVELRHLRYFVAVAEALNVSRAARRLRISQPALSRQIRDLEVDLGVSLFEREARRLRLSNAGRDLLDHGRKLLNEADAFRQRAELLSAGDVGVLRVGATPQTLARLFPPVLVRFARLLPRVEVSLMEGHPAALLSLLRDGELQLALALHQPELPGSRLIGVVPLLAVSKSREGSRADALAIAELRSRPLLLLARGFGSRDLFEGACRVAQLQPEVLLESSAPATLIAFARAGLGVAIVPGTVPFEQRGLSVQRLELDRAPLQAELAVHWNTGRLLPSYAQRFADELAARAQLEFGPLQARRRGRAAAG
jgi:DNA-binding transcriptional LysR family regulator